jgi:hypothetical protein
MTFLIQKKLLLAHHGMCVPIINVSTMFWVHSSKFVTVGAPEVRQQ